MFSSTSGCLDARFVIAGGVLAHWPRYAAPVPLSDTQRLVIAFHCVLVLLFAGFGVYEPWRGEALAPVLARIAAASMVVVASGLVLAFALRRMDAVSRLWFGYSTLTSGALIIASRCALRVVLRTVRSRGMNMRTVAIVRAPCSPSSNMRRKPASNRSAGSTPASKAPARMARVLAACRC